MKREGQAEQKKKGKFVAPDDPFLKDRPKLAEAVADAWWDDGSPRDPFTMSVSWSSGVVVAQLNDKEQDRSLATTADTLEKAGDNFEELLGKSVLPWRYWKSRGKKK